MSSSNSEEGHIKDVPIIAKDAMHQHPGGKGGALSKRPKSDVMLLIYGARYKPDAYRANIRRINEKSATTSGSRCSRFKRQTPRFVPVDESEDEPDAEPDAEPAPGAAGSSASGGLFSMFRR